MAVARRRGRRRRDHGHPDQKLTASDALQAKDQVLVAPTAARRALGDGAGVGRTPRVPRLRPGRRRRLPELQADEGDCRHRHGRRNPAKHLDPPRPELERQAQRRRRQRRGWTEDRMQIGDGVVVTLPEHEPQRRQAERKNQEDADRPGADVPRQAGENGSRGPTRGRRRRGRPRAPASAARAPPGR